MHLDFIKYFQVAVCLGFFFPPLSLFDLAKHSVHSPMLWIQMCIPLKGSSRLAEVSDFQGSRMRGLEQKVKLSKNTNATEQPSFIFPTEHNTKSKQLAQITNTGLPGGWSKTCRIQQYVLHEVQQVFCIRLVARYRRIFFERKMPFEKMWKILLLYLLHVSIVKQSLILF